MGPYPDWVEDRFGDDVPEWAEERWGDDEDASDDDDDQSLKAAFLRSFLCIHKENCKKQYLVVSSFPFLLKFLLKYFNKKV